MDAGNKKSKAIDLVIEECYQTYFRDNNEWNTAKFYRAVCETVEEINKKLGSTQLSVPKTTTLEFAFAKYNKPADGDLSKEEFQGILQELLIETGFTGIGAKDIIFYLFGVPITALMIKKRTALKIHDDLFIPAITSATVFLLAKLKKI
ncbi:hypothetical protein REPUB_Repub06bG0109900 [Reevesia pubescens]